MQLTVTTYGGMEQAILAQCMQFVSCTHFGTVTN